MKEARTEGWLCEFFVNSLKHHYSLMIVGVTSDARVRCWNGETLKMADSRDIGSGMVAVSA